MKRTLIIVALVLIISTSVIAGTLSMYTITLDEFADGSVVAKEFTLVAEGTEVIEESIKIAPGEEVEWGFSVKNYEGEEGSEIVTETAMDLAFTVEISAAEDKLAIEPLKVTVKDGNGGNIPLEEGEFKDEFPLETEGQEKTYTVNIEWPSDDSVDINYAGSGFGTAVKVSVTGTQKQAEQ